MMGPVEPYDWVPHLTPEHWERANRRLVRKALAEFVHERLIAPEPLGPGRYRVRSDDGSVDYTYDATDLALDHWQIDVDSIRRRRNGHDLPLDALDLVLDLRDSLGIRADLLPVYLEEITSTLASSAYKLAHPQSAEALCDAEFQTIEAGMTEGHPCFVANNGRLGFGADDYLRHAPETGRAVRLVWLAARRDRSTFTCSTGMTYEALLRTELDATTLDRFARHMESLGLDLDDFHLFPVHPWQWTNRLTVTFADDVARRRLVCVGSGDDEHQPQQSIRTFFNISRPDRHYVKTSLSILNMGFVRGLSARYMKGTPAINDWLSGLIADDDVLAACRFGILRERAAIGYHHEGFEAAAPTGSPYLKMLAALWRESPVPSLGRGERLATMAALLHVDDDGRSVVTTLIARSGLRPTEWLRRYLHAYLRPLVHCFYAYDLAFMPHGENVILVLEDDVPCRVLMKDLAEEVVLLNATTPLPPEVERIRDPGSDEVNPLAILTDVFDCFFRFLGAILVTDGTTSEAEFWRCVADCVAGYQEQMPQLADKFRRYDLFAERFPRSCLNRLQLRDNRQMIDLEHQTEQLVLVGTLDNPIAAFRPAGRSVA
jgi:siderophore synthetase component